MGTNIVLVLYDRLCGQRVFTAKHKRWQPDCFACCQLSSAVFGHSKARKRMFNYTTKGTFVIVSHRRIRCGGGRSFWRFDHKILLFYAKRGFWLFFNPKQVLLTIFVHKKVRKWVVNHTSKGTPVIIFWSRIIIWWKALFTILWSQNPSILWWTWFLDLFQPQTDAVDHLWTFKGEERSVQPDVYGCLCDCLLDQNQNLVEDVVYDTLVTKSFYLMLNMVFGYFQPEAGAVGHLWTFKGEERSVQPDV